MAIPISLPDSLRAFLDEEMREHGHESLDACAACLLERGQRPMPPRRTFEIDRRTYRLTRLSDGQDFDMRRSSIAIDADLPFEPAAPRSGKLHLAETYAVCRHLFGERGKGLDDWKGGFAFPLALEVPVAARRPAYLLSVMNCGDGPGGNPARSRRVGKCAGLLVCRAAPTDRREPRSTRGAGKTQADGKQLARLGRKTWLYARTCGEYFRISTWRRRPKKRANPGV